MAKVASTLLLLITVIGCSFSVGSGSAAACGPSEVMTTTDEKGQKTSLVLDGRMLEKTPKWAPGAGEPPLSVARATKIAMAWAKVRYKRYDDVAIREISLSRSSACGLSGERWYYQFDFNPIMDGNEMYGSGNWAAVLMDGKVIGATKSK